MESFKSSLYILSVAHHRLLPVQHKFRYAIFMFYLDLDELSLISNSSKLIGFNKKKLYSYFDCDHLENDSENTRSKIQRFLEERGITKLPKKIMLLTNLRIFNYIFNPVSFFFCFDEQDAPIALVAEVHNTFLERKRYLVTPTFSETGMIHFQSRQKKEFYISPFSDLNLDLDFNLDLPGETISFSINDFQKNVCLFKSTLSGKRLPLTDNNLFWLSLKYPLLTLKIIALIHWQAFRLFLKQAPFHNKEANPEQQIDVINPHRSLLEVTNRSQ